MWYVGPIGRKIGEFGGDLGFEVCFDFAVNLAYAALSSFLFLSSSPLQLAAAFAAITFPPLRYLEIKYTGR